MSSDEDETSTALPPHATAWLAGKTAADFEVIEAGGRLFWSAFINRLGADQKWSQTPCRLMVLDVKDLAYARREQGEVFKTLLGIAPTKENRELHQDLWDELEVFAQVSQGLRRAEEPYARFTELEFLVNSTTIKIPRAEVHNLHAQLDVLGGFESARLEKLSLEQVVEMARAIEGVQNTSPLAAIVGRGLDSYVVTSASLLVSYLRGERLSASPEISPRGRSRKKS